MFYMSEYEVVEVLNRLDSIKNRLSTRLRPNDMISMLEEKKLDTIRTLITEIDILTFDME